MRPALLVLAGVFLVAVGCSSPGGADDRFTIYAATSLEDVLNVLAGAYERAAPELDVSVAAGSSATLRTQIEQGAPADVFLSADTTNPQALLDSGLAVGPAVPFAENVLAIIVPASNPAGIRSPADLANDGVAVIAAGDEVPITAYTSELITNLAELPGYPAGFADAYQANVVSKEDNVGAVMAKIALGEGDAAIVYATVGAWAKDVRLVEIPDEANVRAEYTGVAIRSSSRPDRARRFLDWLAGPDGSAILASFGYLPPS